MEGTMGEIRLFAGNFNPQGWASCNGAVLPINENQALFSILGITYGGDGRTTFHLPKLDAPDSAGDGQQVLHYVICIEGVYPRRD